MALCTRSVITNGTWQQGRARSLEHTPQFSSGGVEGFQKVQGDPSVISEVTGQESKRHSW